MPTIDPTRILDDLRTFATFGPYKTGVHRPSLSPQDVEARHWFAGRLGEAGLDARIDGISNVIGYHPGPGPKVLTGSHVESQNHAGRLDGPLGLVYGLEAARALAEDPDFAGCGVDVGAWFDEEGHFGSFLGSRSFLGLVSEHTLDRAADRTAGTPLREALRTAGFAGRPREHLPPGRRYRGYFEAHIEQSDVLESADLKIGVVTAIVGIWQHRLVATGEQNHAGTTRMDRRKDAGLALVRLLAAIDRTFPEVAGPRSVWTTGAIRVEPGAPSVIPGRAEAQFQIRDADLEVLERMHEHLQALVREANARGPCTLSIEVTRQSAPARMDEGFQRAIEAAAAVHCPGKAVRMPSAAGHDAAILAFAMPSAMLFVPSIGGISHHWDENTADEDIVLGCRVFVDAIARVLRG